MESWGGALGEGGGAPTVDACAPGSGAALREGGGGGEEPVGGGSRRGGGRSRGWGAAQCPGRLGPSVPGRVGKPSSTSVAGPCSTRGLPCVHVLRSFLIAKT